MTTCDNGWSPPDKYQGEEQDDNYHPSTTQLVEENTDSWVEEPSQCDWDESDRKSDNGVGSHSIIKFGDQNIEEHQCYQRRPTNKELILGVPKLEKKRNRPMRMVDETVNE